MNRRRSAARRSRESSEQTASPSPQLRIAFPSIVVGGGSALLVAATLQPTENAWLDGSTAPYCLLWFVLGAAWIASLFLRQSEFRRLDWGDYGVLAVVGWAIIASIVRIFAQDANARATLNMGWQWPALGTAYVLFRQLFASAERLRQVVSLAIGISVLLSAAGLYQFFYDLPRTREAYQSASEQQKQQILRDARVPEVESGSRTRALFENRLESLEPMATFGLANSLAALLSTFLVVLLGCGWQSLRRIKSRPLFLAGWIAAALALAICLMLTKSRTGYLGLIVGVLLVVGIQLRAHFSRRTIAVVGVSFGGAIGLIAALGIALGTLDVQVITETAKSASYRLEYWRSTARMMVDAPMFGCGPGNFQDTYAQYKLPQASETVADPHNFLLEIGANCGIPAMLLTLSAIAGAVWRARRIKTVEAAQDHSDESIDPVRQADQKPRTGDRVDIWIGAAVGVAIALVVGPSAGFEVDWGLLLIGLVVAIPITIAVYRSMDPSRPPVGVLGVGLIVLLVNLLATGGIGFLAVAQFVVLLVALVANRHHLIAVTDQGRAGESLSADRRNLMLSAGAIVALALIVGAQQTLLLPVMRSRAAIGQAESAIELRRFDEAETHLLAAKQADPWGADASRLLAFLSFQRWQMTEDPAHLDEMESALQDQIARRPRPSQMYREIGDWYLVAFGRTNKLEYLDRSSEAYSKAIDRYPTNGWLHAQLAYVLSLGGHDEQAAASAAEALRLDDLTPHQDLKLARRPILESSGRRSERSTEQVMRELRNP